MVISFMWLWILAKKDELYGKRNLVCKELYKFVEPHVFVI